MQDNLIQRYREAMHAMQVEAARKEAREARMHLMDECARLGYWEVERWGKNHEFGIVSYDDFALLNSEVKSYTACCFSTDQVLNSSTTGGRVKVFLKSANSWYSHWRMLMIVGLANLTIRPT